MKDYNEISDKITAIFNKGKSEDYLEFQDAAWSGDIIKLKSLKFPLEESLRGHCYDLLNIPLFHGHIEVIEYIIDKGWRRPTPDDDGFRHLVAIYGNDYLIKLFTEKNIFDEDDFSCMRYNSHFIATAAEANNLETLIWMLNLKKFDIEDIKYAMRHSVSYGGDKTFLHLARVYKENKEFNPNDWKTYMKQCLTKARSNMKRNENKEMSIVQITSGRYKELIEIIKREIITISH